jgi:hypothetical protein
MSRQKPDSYWLLQQLERDKLQAVELLSRLLETVKNAA